MKKTIWIIEQYASSPQRGMGGRHYYLADELAKRGCNVYVIAANNHHLLREPLKMRELFYFDKSQSFTFVWVDMPSYKEAHSKQRALNWLLFPCRIQKLVKKISHKPDVILASSPSPFAFLGAERLAKKFKARLFFEVRDIWPLTLMELGGYSPKHPFIRFMQWVEDRAYKKADGVISNLKNSVKHMESRGMDPAKFSWIANGFSLSEVIKNVPLNLKSQSQLPKDKFIVGYTGTFGVANALDTLIEAAERVKDLQEIAFVLVGQGREEKKLKALVQEKGLQNVYFLSPIPKVEIQAMLTQFDVCYIGLTKDPLFRFGVSPNKLFDYLYSGRPILYSIDSGDYHPVNDSGAGIEVVPEKPEDLASAILTFYTMPKEKRKQMGENGRKVALEQYEYGVLAGRMERVLFDIKYSKES